MGARSSIAPTAALPTDASGASGGVGTAAIGVGVLALTIATRMWL